MCNARNTGPSVALLQHWESLGAGGWLVRGQGQGWRRQKVAAPCGSSCSVLRLWSCEMEGLQVVLGCCGLKVAGMGSAVCGCDAKVRGAGAAAAAAAAAAACCSIVLMAAGDWRRAVYSVYAEEEG